MILRSFKPLIKKRCKPHNYEAPLFSNKDEKEQLRKIKDDSWELHHTAYFTLISIVQGAVFSFMLSLNINGEPFLGNLLDIIVKRELFSNNIFHLLKEDGLLYINSLLVIILIWNNYIRGVFPINYMPGVMDGAYPFLFGLAESLMIYGHTKDPVIWFLGFFLVVTIGVGAYFNMYSGLTHNEGDNVWLYKYLYRFLSIKMKFLLIAAILSLAVFFFIYQHLFSVLWCSLISFVLIMAYMAHDECWWYRLRDIIRILSPDRIGNQKSGNIDNRPPK